MGQFLLVAGGLVAIWSLLAGLAEGLKAAPDTTKKHWPYFVGGVVVAVIGIFLL